MGYLHTRRAEVATAREPNEKAFYEYLKSINKPNDFVRHGILEFRDLVEKAAVTSGWETAFAEDRMLDREYVYQVATEVAQKVVADWERYFPRNIMESASVETALFGKIPDKSRLPKNVEVVTPAAYKKLLRTGATLDKWYTLMEPKDNPKRTYYIVDHGNQILKVVKR